MQDSLIAKLNKRGLKSLFLEDIGQSAVLISPTRVTWNEDKLRILLRRKGVKKSLMGKVFTEKVVTVLHENILDRIIKAGIVTTEDLEDVSTIKENSAYVRFFKFENKE